MNRLPSCVFATLFIASLAGCAEAPSEEPQTQSATQEIRALEPTEIVGTIAHGQTKSVAYTSSPRFRALSFQGKAGDKVDLWVKSTTGDAMAWLATSAFANVATNDDAAPGQKDAHITATLPATGLYYLALRDKTLANATFTVSLTVDAACDPDEEVCGDGGAPPACNPDEEDCANSGLPADPFVFKQGPMMAYSDLLKYFPPGQLKASVGTFTLVSRTRAQCTQSTGCTPWVEPSPVTLMQISSTGGLSSGVTHALPTSGSAELILKEWSNSSAISIRFSNNEPGAPQQQIQFDCGSITPKTTGVDYMDCISTVSFSNPLSSGSSLWFPAMYLGAPRFDNTTMVSWRGRIYADGIYHFVSMLATELGTDVTGANNRNQIALYGKLKL